MAKKHGKNKTPITPATFAALPMKVRLRRGEQLAVINFDDCGHS